MSIVTKKGDKGKTNSLTNVNISKSSLLIETYGYLDEVNSTIGLITGKFAKSKTFYNLVEIQKSLMLIGSHLADTEQILVKESHLKKLKGDIQNLEAEIKKQELKMPKLTNFIVPVGCEKACLLHIARTKVRALERKVVKLSKKQYVNKYALQYLNRLSDYLFSLARYTNYQEGIKDVKWKL